MTCQSTQELILQDMFAFYVLCLPSPPQLGNEFTCCCSRIFPKQCFNRCVTLRLMSLREMPTRQHTHTTKIKSTKICTIPQLPSCSERCNVRLIRDTHLKASFTLIIRPIVIRLNFTQQLLSTVATWLSFHEKRQADPES